jgi:hypothetical protein
MDRDESVAGKTMKVNGWIRAELVIAAFVLFGALHVLSSCDLN